MQRISDIPLQLDELQQAELAREFQTGEVQSFTLFAPLLFLNTFSCEYREAHVSFLPCSGRVPEEQAKAPPPRGTKRKGTGGQPRAAEFEL